MSKASTSRQIKFDEFGGLDQIAWQQMALDPWCTPLWLRIMYAACGWSNTIGHAEFTNRGRTLFDVLMVPDGTGGYRRVSRNHLVKEIANARRRGLVDEGSSPECLVAPPWFDKAAGHRLTTRTCHTHGIRGARPRADRAPHRPADTESVSPEAGNDTESVSVRNQIGYGATP